MIFLIAERAIAAGNWIYPVSGCWVSGRYYQDYTKVEGSNEVHHTGMDIACVKDTPVYASHDGPVAVAQNGWLGYFGEDVFIYDKATGVYSFYAHMSVSYVSVGQNVKQGETIGLTGCMPGDVACHLHYSSSTAKPEQYWSFPSWETHAQDNSGVGWTNPMNYINGTGSTVANNGGNWSTSAGNAIERPDFYGDFAPEDGYEEITAAFWAEFKPDENTPLGVAGLPIESGDGKSVSTTGFEMQTNSNDNQPAVTPATKVTQNAEGSQNEQNTYPLPIIGGGIIIVLSLLGWNQYKNHRINQRLRRKRRR